MITDNNDPMYWINSGIKLATSRLIELSGATAAVAICTAIAVEDHDDPLDPIESAAVVQMLGLMPLLRQFQEHYTAILAAGWKDAAFYKPDRWFSAVPPITVDPES